VTFGSVVAQNCTAAQYNYVSQQMRQLARLLTELRDQTQAPHTDLLSFLKPEKFDALVAAVLPLSNSNTHATDHSVPYSSGGNNVDSGEFNGSDDMNACNSTDCKQKTEGYSQSSLTTSVEKLKAITAATIANMPGKRCCDKRYFCLFCDKPQAKLKTHLISQHSSELEVAEITAKKT